MGFPAAVDQPVPLRPLLGDFEPGDFKLHCATFNGESQPLDVFATSWEHWSDWNRWRPAKNEFNRRFVFSMIQIYSERHRWLYGGAFEVLGDAGIPDAHSYKIAYRPQILPGCTGRLKLHFERSGRQGRLNLDRWIDEISVAEILPRRYTGEPFPGHDAIDISFGELATVYAQQRSDWRDALKHMKGVYVLHDAKTGRAYVGSAYGDTGIWARWGQYVETAHGGNAELRQLVTDKGADYIRDNFRVALLEYWSMRTSDDAVLDRETYWKNVLLSREFGWNAN